MENLSNDITQCIQLMNISELPENERKEAQDSIDYANQCAKESEETQEAMRKHGFNI